MGLELLEHWQITNHCASCRRYLTKGQEAKLTNSPDFPTIDPAPASSTGPTDVPSLRADLLNTKKPLFERYRAMFALRDYGGNSREAVLALAEGFGDESALFR